MNHNTRLKCLEERLTALERFVGMGCSSETDSGLGFIVACVDPTENREHLFYMGDEHPHWSLLQAHAQRFSNEEQAVLESKKVKRPNKVVDYPAAFPKETEF